LWIDSYIPFIYNKYRYKGSFLKNVNNFENFLRKYLQFKIKALPLHPQSGKQNGLTG
jgi:hypothetical protein